MYPNNRMADASYSKLSRSMPLGLESVLAPDPLETTLIMLSTPAKDICAEACRFTRQGASRPLLRTFLLSRGKGPWAALRGSPPLW